MRSRSDFRASFLKEQLGLQLQLMNPGTKQTMLQPFNSGELQNNGSAGPQNFYGQLHFLFLRASSWQKRSKKYLPFQHHMVEEMEMSDRACLNIFMNVRHDRTSDPE